jgi:hypothetical protein
MQFNRHSGDLRVQTGHFDTDNWISRYRTNCCALGQLSLSSINTLEEIVSVIELIKEESNKEISQMQRDGAERAIFVCTLPEEKTLEKNLGLAGFKMIYEFHRRAYNPESSMLKMWIISW